VKELPSCKLTGKTYQAAAVSAATTALERKIIIGILAVTAVFLSWEGTSKLTGYSSRDDVVEVVLELGNDVAGLSLPFGFRVAVAAAELQRAWRMCLSVRYPRRLCTEHAGRHLWACLRLACQ
jgi:hypothetical protein